VVDDNQTNRDICSSNWKARMRDLRGRWGGAAADGAGVEAGVPFHLAILDMHMPKMDGLQLAMPFMPSRSWPLPA
jgi:CheY-like chemotaxis protein